MGRRAREHTYLLAQEREECFISIVLRMNVVGSADQNICSNKE